MRISVTPAVAELIQGSIEDWECSFAPREHRGLDDFYVELRSRLTDLGVADNEADAIINEVATGIMAESGFLVGGLPEDIRKASLRDPLGEIATDFFHEMLYKHLGPGSDHGPAEVTGWVQAVIAKSHSSQVSA